MTKQEFIEEVNDFWVLKDFCAENECWELDEIIDSDTLDDYVWEDIRDWNDSWISLGEALCEISRGYDWYRRDGILDYVYMDNSDFIAYKDDVLDWAESRGVFDVEEADQYGEEDWFTDPLTGEMFLAGPEIEIDQSAAGVDGFLEL